MTMTALLVTQVPPLPLVIEKVPVAPVSGTAQAICVTPSVATIAATIFYAQF